VRLASIAHYKFDRGLGDEAVNWAGIEGGARGVGKLTRATGSPWAPGRFGDFALSAGSSCETGYHGDLGARFTVAWFMRERTAPTGVSPVFALGDWRCFTGGPAGTGLLCVGWGGTPIDLPDDIQALARNGWVHVALVVDADTREARWYVNGMSRRRVPLTAMVAIPGNAAALRVGSSNGQACVYDLDEFRLGAAAVDSGTVAAWANASLAAAEPFSAACGAVLRHRGQPSLGTTFDYRIEATPGSVVGLFVGTARAPFDLGILDPGLSGCRWYSSLDLGLPPFVAGASGVVVLPIPVPNATELRGLELYVQALVVEAGRLRASNAHAISLD
jgi:hypothetical protein